MSDEHIAQVLNAYGTIQEKLSNVVSFDEVAQNNDFNLNLPRYVNTKDPEPIPDFLTEAMELLEITKGLEQSGKQFIDMLEQIQITGTKKDIDEFEQAKSALKQAFAPRKFNTQIMQKIKQITPQNYQMTIFDEEELNELDGLINQKQKQINTLQNIKKYFLGKMFV